MEEIVSDPDELYSKVDKRPPTKQQVCVQTTTAGDSVNECATQHDLYDNITMDAKEDVLFGAAKDFTFTVALEETEASRRCNLGNTEYRLCVDASGLSLQVQQIVLFKWPYKFIRRYGSGQELFLVEVGRRADSGEGLFKFKTTTPEQLQTAVKARMNRGSGRCSTQAAVEDLYATVNKPKRNNGKVLMNAL